MEAELRPLPLPLPSRKGGTHAAPVSAPAPATYLGYSTEYRDSTSSRVLSYHHVTLHSLAERSRYEYRVRVASSSATKHNTTVQWRRTTGIKWCSGTNYSPGDPFGQGFDGNDAWCPLLPPHTTKDQQVAMCEAVCAAPNASACDGFTFYPNTTAERNPSGMATCCFRGSTADKPRDPTSSAECYEKVGQPAPCPAQPSAWSAWLNFKSLYSAGPTRLALYADMGVFVTQGANAPHNPTSLPAPARHNVGNLVDDLAAGQ